MKKTISITLGGRVFIIEEDAFQLLETYLNGLKKHFAKDGTSDELMTDIETGIGEKFAEKLSTQKEAIMIDDVQEVIKVMGELEEITEETEDHKKTSSRPKRLYRDTDDTVIAGVCSGLAAYFGISTTVVRIVFLVFTLFNGIGIVAYLILWAAVPRATTSAQKLEMRGKAMNVDEIEQLLKDKAQKISDEGKEAYERFRSKDHSTLHKILNIPVVVIDGIIRGIRGFFRALGPLVSTIIGSCMMIASIVGLTATTITASLFLFPTKSPYFVSDLPLTELASQPLYYVGIVALCVLALVPLVFLMTLASTLIRRKNSFRATPTAFLVTLWIIAACAAAVAARDIAPWLSKRVQDIERRTTISRNFAFTQFDTIQTSNNIRLSITKGENYRITATGSKTEIDRIDVTQQNGVLVFKTNAEHRGPCLFCISRPVEIEMTIPALTSVTTRDISYVEIRGFSQDILLTASDASGITLEGQHATITVNTHDIARIELSGNANMLVAQLHDASRLNAEDLVVTNKQITTEDISHADVE